MPNNKHPERQRGHQPRYLSGHRRVVKFQDGSLIESCQECPLGRLAQVESGEETLASICESFSESRKSCGYLRTVYGDTFTELKKSFPKAFKQKLEVGIECCIQATHLKFYDLLIRVHGMVSDKGVQTHVAKMRAEHQKMFLMIYRSIEGPAPKPKTEKASRFDPELLGALGDDNGQE